jgi:hypothetical protein
MTLGFQNALLITGYAVFGAAYYKRCSLSIYHIKMLSKLEALIFSCAWASFASTFHVLMHSLKREKRGWALGPFKLISLFGLVVISVIGPIFLMNTETPKFRQPAMAVPAYCFTPNSFTVLPKVEGKVGRYSTDFLMGFAIFIPPFIYSIMACVREYRKVRFGNFGKAVMLMLLGASFAFIVLIIWDLFTSRDEAQDYVNKDTSEKDWGFGQVVALVLLIGPLWTLLETFTGRRPPLILLITFSADKSP